MLSITRGQTAAYHPEVNGAFKRLHHHLKDALHACTAAATWAEEILSVLLGLRCQPREVTGLSLLKQFLVFPLFLLNEFLQAEEFSADQIWK
jgi:hypothetical protein